MRISFDLDDLLICYQSYVPREPNRVPFFLRPWLEEPLRLGAMALLRELQAEGHEIWVYTTSLRESWRVRAWLRCYGVRVGRVLNGTDNEEALRASGHLGRLYKYPRYFNIDLHIDDAEGLEDDGKHHNFQALTISPGDAEWTDKVKAAVEIFSQP